MTQSEKYRDLFTVKSSGVHIDETKEDLVEDSDFDSYISMVIRSRNAKRELKRTEEKLKHLKDSFNGKSNTISE